MGRRQGLFSDFKLQLSQTYWIFRSHPRRCVFTTSDSKKSVQIRELFSPCAKWVLLPQYKPPDQPGFTVSILHSENKDHCIQSHHFMVNRWRNNGNSGRLYFFCSKITADSDYSYKIKRHLLLGRKVMTNLNSILKSRDITLQTKVHLVKAMVFPAVMYGCKSWTIKKAEHQRIDSFELWCWRRLLRVP